MKNKKNILILLFNTIFIVLIIIVLCCQQASDSSGGGSKGGSGKKEESPWSTQLLGVIGVYTDAYGITSDLNGNVYTTGNTIGNLDGETLTGTRDLFVVKYNSAGVKQWTRLLGAAGVYTEARGITSDLSGNVYTTGFTEGNLDGHILTGTRDLFVVKYDSSGNKLWTRLLGVTGKSTTARGTTSDSSSNVYTTGYTNGNLDGKTLTGTVDLFVVKYDSSGNKLWTRLLGVTGAYTYAYGITSDLNGNVYTTGFTEGNLDGKTLTGIVDLFVVKYDPSGNKLWTRLLGASGAFTYARGITSDLSGNVYTTGYIEGGFLDGQTLTGLSDLFVVKYDSNGNKFWTRLLGVAGVYTDAYGITSDLSGNVYMTGWTNGNLDEHILTGIRDLFVVKYDSSGNNLWTELLGVAGAETNANGITSDLNGNVYTTGWTKGNLDGQTLTGLSDLFVVKYNSNGVRQ